MQIPKTPSPVENVQQCSAIMDNSNINTSLDVSRSSVGGRSSSAKKLRQLGLPKNLPKSCEYSDQYSILMASGDEEGDVEEDKIREESVEDEGPMEFETTPLALEENCIKFIMSHFISPSKFYVHQACENTVVCLEGIMAGLQDYMRENKPVPLSNPAPGPCVAKFTDDDVFYRAQIVSVNTDDDRNITSASVLYVDFGNSETLTPDRLFKLPKHFLHVPPQAVPFGLADVKPVPKTVDGKITDEDGPKEMEEWSPEASKAFDERISPKKVYVAYLPDTPDTVPTAE